jgi:hypothetical protein
MKPSAQGTPGPGTAEGRGACDRAFALSCRYSRGQDLAEEMVATNYWPLGRRMPAMIIEMVHLSVFSEGVGVPFPRFGFQWKEDRVAEKFVKSVEAGVREILGEMSDKEYLARRAIAGTMPRLNRVFEEFEIHHDEHDVPAKVHKSLEDKAKKATNKNTPLQLRQRKGRGLARLRLLPRNRRPRSLLLLPPLVLMRRLWRMLVEVRLLRVLGWRESISPPPSILAVIFLLGLLPKEWVVVLLLKPPLWCQCPVFV